MHQLHTFIALTSIDGIFRMLLIVNSSEADSTICYLLASDRTVLGVHLTSSGIDKLSTDYIAQLQNVYIHWDL